MPGLAGSAGLETPAAGSPLLETAGAGLFRLSRDVWVCAADRRAQGAHHHYCVHVRVCIFCHYCQMYGPKAYGAFSGANVWTKVVNGRCD